MEALPGNGYRWRRHLEYAWLSHSTFILDIWRTQYMLSKRTRLWLGLFVAVGLISLASACSKTETEDDTGDTGSTGKTYAAKGNEGTISGVVSYTGAAPEGKKIDTSADPACTSKSPK